MQYNIQEYDNDGSEVVGMNLFIFWSRKPFEMLGNNILKSHDMKFRRGVGGES